MLQNLQTASTHMPVTKLSALMPTRFKPNFQPTTLMRTMAGSMPVQPTNSSTGLLPAAEGGPGLVESVPGGMTTILAVGGVVLALVAVGVGIQMYAGQKVGRAMVVGGDNGSGWGWFWAGLGGPIGAGVLGFKRSGSDMGERMDFLKNAWK